MQKKDENQVEKKINRHPVLYIISTIILVVIIVTFIGAPLAGNIGSSKNMVFGNYDGEDIEFYPGNYLSNQKDMLAQKIDKNDESNFQMQAYQVWRGAFERTVLHMALLKEVLNSGFKVSEDKIDKSIVKFGPYTINGEFSTEKYNNSSSMDKKNTRKYIEETVVKEQYINDYFYGKKTSSHEKDFIKNMTSSERSLNIVKLPFSEYPESEILNYADSNKDLFRSMKISKITILSGKKDAEKVFSIVKENSDSFSDTAKNQSKDSYAANGGDMGNVYYHSLKTELKNPEEAETVFALVNNSVSNLIETNNGWVIFKSNSDLNSEYETDTVKEYMLKYELGKIEDYFTEKAQNLKNSGNLLAAALDEDYEIVKTESFPINYGNNMFLKPVTIKDESNSLSNIAYNEEFFLNAFSISKGEVSEPVVLNDSIIVMNVDTVTETDPSSDTLLDSYYPYLVQQIDDTGLSSYFISSEKVTDNFNETFSKNFLNN